MYIKKLIVEHRKKYGNSSRKKLDERIEDTEIRNSTPVNELIALLGGGEEYEYLHRIDLKGRYVSNHLDE